MRASRRSSGRLLLLGMMMVAPMLGVLAVLSPALAAAVVIVAFMAAGFLRSGTFAVATFAFATYFQVLDSFTGVLLSPVKLTGGGLILAAIVVLLQPVPADVRPSWRSMPVVMGGLAAYLVIATASVAWAADPGRSGEFLWRLIVEVLVMLAIGVLVTRPRQLRAVLGWIVAAAATSTLLGMGVGTSLFDRFIGAFGDPNDYAAATVPAIVIILCLWPITRSAAVRAAMSVATVLMLYGIVESESRGGLLALVIGVAVVIQTARGSERIRLVGVALACGAVVGMALAFTPEGAAFSAKLASGDTSGRTDLWTVAVNMFQAHPLSGVGLGNYYIVSANFLDSTVQHLELFVQDARVAHNTTLEMLAELGIPGTIAYYTFVIGAVAVAVRGLRAARRDGSRELVQVGRAVVSATIGSIATCLTLSGQYQPILWVLLGCCISYGAAATGRSGTPR